MFAGHSHILFDLLASRGVVEPSVLRDALEQHTTTGRSFAGILIESGVLDLPQFLCAIAEYLDCDYADKLPETIPADIISLVDGDLARSHEIVPVAVDGNVVIVLSADPLNPHLVGDMTFALGRAIRLAVGNPEEIRKLIRLYYATNATPSAQSLIQVPESVPIPDETDNLTEADIEKMAGETPIVRLVNQILGQGIRERASDIHFEPFEREFKIRYRKDGTLSEMPQPSRALALPIISRLKVLANLNIAERRLPQDGRIQLQIGGRAVDLRISTLPTQFGESVVLRVLDQSAGRLDLAEIGMPPAIRAGVEAIIARPNGIFVVTGPTGSGKTTTLYSCLKKLNSIDSKLLSVEDPVEYEIDGAMQVPVNLGAGLTFARALRTFLRQDPDVVMVGEIRDLETAQIALQASLTGHLVLTTLHTNDAAGTVTRLVDMGIEPFLLASTLEGVLAQRLVRRICSACKQVHQPEEILLRQLGLDEAVVRERRFYFGAGCPACHQSGYAGRTGIFEFMRISESLRELIMQGASLVQMRQCAVSEGMISLRMAGIEAVLAGETTLDEILKYT